MAIKPDGTVMPCMNVCDEKFSLGNMLIDSWKEIWNCAKTNKIKKLALIDVTKCPIKKYVQK